METNILIGITGRMGRGKSTLAEQVAAFIDGAQVVALSDALKGHVHAVVEQEAGITLTHELIAEHKGTVFGPIYQGWGELFRTFAWSRYWVARLDAALPRRAVVADIRYPNEAEWIQERGGLLVAVQGPCRREGDQRATDHPSERFVDEIAATADVVVLNEGDLEHLRSEARRIAGMAVVRARGGVRD